MALSDWALVAMVRTAVAMTCSRVGVCAVNGTRPARVPEAGGWEPGAGSRAYRGIPAPGARLPAFTAGP
jgi:hypothetical protein